MEAILSWINVDRAMPEKVFFTISYVRICVMVVLVSYNWVNDKQR